MKDDAARLEAELAALVARSARELFGVRRWSEPVALALAFEPDGEGGFRIGGRRLHELLEQALREAAAQSSPVQAGRVYCYRCETARCDHAVPRRATEVFQGYGSTGLPQWVDLGQALLENRHQDVDRLYADGGRKLLTLFQAGRELKSQQLSAFGRSSKSYDVLCQVIAGYFPLRDESLALTLQAVEHRGTAREIKLELNAIGRTAAGEHSYSSLLAARGLSLAEPLRKARRALAELERRLADADARSSRKRRSQLLGRVPGILRSLARDIVTPERRQRRRTHHAEERRRESRPVPAAIREAERSPQDKTLIDERDETVVVLGRKNRVHIFSAATARLVTSLTLEPDAVTRRLRQKRWRPATRAEWSELQRRLRHPPDEA